MMKKLDGLMINRLGRKAFEAANEVDNSKRLIAASYLNDDLSDVIDRLIDSQKDLRESLSVIQDELGEVASYADCNPSHPLVFCVNLNGNYYRVELNAGEVRVDGYESPDEDKVLEYVRRCFYEA